jgi:hypothetical protein
MDSIDYFDKRKNPKKENTDFLKEWNSLKKGKKTLEKKNNEPKPGSQKNNERENAEGT